MLEFIRQKIRDLKYIPFQQLAYGELNDRIYTNPLINWEIKIPPKFKTHLPSYDERKEYYDISTSGRVMSPKKEINDSLRWTRLIDFKNGSQHFQSKIRRVELFEKINFRNQHKNWVKRLKFDSYVEPKFDYKLSDLK